MARRTTARADFTRSVAAAAAKDMKSQWHNLAELASLGFTQDDVSMHFGADTPHMSESAADFVLEPARLDGVTALRYMVNGRHEKKSCGKCRLCLAKLLVALPCRT